MTTFNPVPENVMVGILPPVLVVEDQADDLFFLELAFQDANVANPLMVAHDGHEAIQYLNTVASAGSANATVATFPALMLLDLKMPVMNGFEVLAWIRSRPQFASLPVVVFSGSDMESDMERAQQLKAAGYYAKPYHPREYAELIRRMQKRWLSPSDPAANLSATHPPQFTNLALCH